MTQELVLQTLTLRELHERLKGRLEQEGQDAISYQTLSELLGVDDVAQQLEIGGGKNARRISPACVDILAAFVPYYRANRGRLPQAANMLRGFLEKGSSVQQNSASSSSVPAELIRVAPAGGRGEPDMVQIAQAQGRAQGLAEREQVMTPQEAADFCRISVRQLRRTRKPSLVFGKQERYLLSDLVK